MHIWAIRFQGTLSVLGEWLIVNVLTRPVPCHMSTPSWWSPSSVLSDIGDSILRKHDEKQIFSLLLYKSEVEAVFSRLAFTSYPAFIHYLHNVWLSTMSDIHFWMWPSCQSTRLTHGHQEHSRKQSPQWDNSPYLVYTASHNLGKCSLPVQMSIFLTHHKLNCIPRCQSLL